MSKTEGQLKEEQSANETRAEWGAWAIVFGLVLEIVLAVRFPVGETLIENWAPVLADSLIALGVYAEIHFSRKASGAEKELTRISNEKVASANKDAAKAHEMAAALEKEAADARERTAAIEQLTAWRHVLPEQRHEIVDAIRNKAPLLDVLIEYEIGDAEAFAFGLELVKLFTDAGVERIRGGSNSFLAAPVFGLRMAIDPVVDAATVVMDAFVASGLGPVIEKADLSKHLPQNVPAPNLYIFVAPKPPPSLMAAEPR